MGDINSVYFNWQEYLEELAIKLDSLHDMVDIVNFEFQREKMEQPVISCLNCIGYCINDIKSDINKKVVQLAEYNKHEKDVNVT